jgi:putative transposase
MLDRIDNWSAYLSRNNDTCEIDTIKRHTRTGRPVGATHFINKIEQLTGKSIAPKRPGPRPSSSN